jgi:hypothetical protein
MLHHSLRLPALQGNTLISGPSPCHMNGQQARRTPARPADVLATLAMATAPMFLPMALLC